MSANDRHKKPFDASPFAAAYGRRQIGRLNERFKRIFDANMVHIKGKRILDLAAHDGRWSWAALQAGAAYVEGVEGRAELVAEGQRHLKDFARDSWALRQGDVFDCLESSQSVFDTVLCLGIFYHISDHFRLLRLMERRRPSCIIIDSALLTTQQLQIGYRLEETGNILNAIPDEKKKADELVGTMSRGLLEKWCNNNGWTLKYVPWIATEIAENIAVRDYLSSDRARARFTCVLTPR